MLLRRSARKVWNFICQKTVKASAPIFLLILFSYVYFTVTIDDLPPLSWLNPFARALEDPTRPECKISTRKTRLRTKFDIVVWNRSLFTWPDVSESKPLSKDIQQDLHQQLNKEGIHIEEGGIFCPLSSPQDVCSKNQRIAILVPFRRRYKNLATFLSYIHRFLSLQQICYQIFVLEQVDTSLFNRAKLFNAALREIGLGASNNGHDFEPFDCFVLHDVDKLPANIQIRYSCPPTVRQLVRWVITVEENASMDTVNTLYDGGINEYYSSFMGGVTIFSRSTLLKINGASNTFHGWGGEDDDIVRRLHLVMEPYTVVEKPVGLFFNLGHQFDNPRNHERSSMLAWRAVRYRLKYDGLIQTQYTLRSIEKHLLYTHLKFEL